MEEIINTLTNIMVRQIQLSAAEVTKMTLLVFVIYDSRNLVTRLLHMLNEKETLEKFNKNDTAAYVK